MPKHDPLCRNAGLRWEVRLWCACDLIAKVRADEREKNKPLYTAALMQHMQDRLDLRDKVESLLSHHPTELVDYQWNLAINAVLALIDRDNDD